MRIYLLFHLPPCGTHLSDRHQLADDSLSNTNGYHNSTALWTTRPGTVASLVFQGTDIYLYSAKSPRGGEMNVTCDWDVKSVHLNNSELMPGEMVWKANDLDPTKLHAVRVEMVRGCMINIDYVGINPGPASAIPPSIPSPLPSGKHRTLYNHEKQSEQACSILWHTPCRRCTYDDDNDCHIDYDHDHDHDHDSIIHTFQYFIFRRYSKQVSPCLCLWSR